MMSPWTVLGWLLVAIIAIGAVAIPVMAWISFRNRRRAFREWHEKFDARRAEIRSGTRVPTEKRFKP